MMLPVILAVMLCGWASASEDGADYDYLLVLPFQHDYYQPADSRALGLGNGIDFGSGPGALFGNPSRIASRYDGRLLISCSGLSGSRSGLSLTTGSSPALPSAAAGAFRRGSHHLALGWRRAMDADLGFPDPLDPAAADRAGLRLEQYAAGWSLSAINHLAIGLSVSLSRFKFDWDGPDGRLAGGGGTAPGFSAGLAADLGQDICFSAGFRSKAEMSCYTEFAGDSAASRLKLAGTVPPAGWVALTFAPEPGFEAFADMELTGWHLVSSGYLEQMDYHLGCRVELVPDRLEALAGSYSLKHPLDPFLRRYDPHLQDLYFISGGLACRLGPLELVCSAAASRPLSGGGMNQNLISASVEYQGHPR